MAVFTDLEHTSVILKSGGVYRQVICAKYNGRLFAKSGSGYIMLHEDGQTPVPKTSWEGLEGAPQLYHVLGSTAMYLNNPGVK